MPKFKPNAYGEFVSEFRKAKALENISYPTFDAAAKDAAPIWETMSASEKEKYKHMAQRHRQQLESNVSVNNNNSIYNKGNSTVSSKKTCQGKLLAEVDFKEQRIQEFIKKKKLYTQNLIRSSPAPAQLVFNIMHTVTYIVDENQYYHAEVALVKFNLNSGIQSMVQMFIDHEALPTGYLHEAKSRQEKEHRIVLPPQSRKILNTKSYRTALNELTQLMQADADGFYHIYTKEEDIRPVENFFERAALDMGEPNFVTGYLIHDYFDLYFNFVKMACKDQEADSVYRALIKETISSDRYDMKKNLCCEYHDEVDALSHCSLSKARRWTHYICEDVCNKLNIYMIEGFHFPLGVMLHQVFPQAQQSKENHQALVHANKSYPLPTFKHGDVRNLEWQKQRVSGKREKHRQDQRQRPINGSATTSAPRQGATASCTKLSRGGGPHKSFVKDRENSSSSDELDLPHNDINYARLIKPWEAALSARDVDPTLRNESTDDEGIQLADEMLEALDLTREVPLRNKFPKRRGGSNDS